MKCYDTYYYYDKEQDEVIGCTWDEYVKADPKFWVDNLYKVKHDQFVLSYEDMGVHIEESCNQHIISTVCLPVDQDSIFMTLISSSNNNYNAYHTRYTCLIEAKKMHDQIILKIIRGEELTGGSKWI